MTTNATIHPADVRVVPDWELCDRLRRSLRLTPLTNEEVAEIMGVRRPTISTWLHGRRVPSKTVLMVWADMTGVDRQWLETGTPSADFVRHVGLEPTTRCFALRPAETSYCPVVQFPVKPGLTMDWRVAS